MGDTSAVTTKTPTAVVTASLGSPFFLSGDLKKTGNIGTDLDVFLPFNSWSNEFQRMGLVFGLGTMAHTASHKHSERDESVGGGLPPSLLDAESTAVSSVHDRAESSGGSDSSRLSVVQARFGAAVDYPFTKLIGDIDAYLGIVLTVGYSNADGNAHLFDAMVDASFFLYFAPRFAAGISLDTGDMIDLSQSSDNWYIEPSMAFRIEM